MAYVEVKNSRYCQILNNDENGIYLYDCFMFLFGMLGLYSLLAWIGVFGQSNNVIYWVGIVHALCIFLVLIFFFIAYISSCFFHESKLIGEELV